MINRLKKKKKKERKRKITLGISMNDQPETKPGLWNKKQSPNYKDAKISSDVTFLHQNAYQISSSKDVPHKK